MYDGIIFSCVISCGLTPCWCNLILYDSLSSWESRLAPGKQPGLHNTKPSTALLFPWKQPIFTIPGIHFMEPFWRKACWLAPSKKPSLQITSSAIQTFQRQRTSDMSNPGCEILFPAEKKFWGSPELVEKRDKVIKKVLPEGEEFIFLAHMRPKMKLLC